MRNKIPEVIEKQRITRGMFASRKEYGFNGMFIVKYMDVKLVIIVSDQEGWDHVSVSVHPFYAKRTPTWAEMCFVKGMFWENEETVIQIHPPKSKNVNIHKHCLHLWRNQSADIVLPPIEMV